MHSRDLPKTLNRVDVEALIGAGKLAEAAAELRAKGDLERAQSLYEKLWDFRTAAEIARERGDRPDALRLLLEAGALAEAAELSDQLLGADRGEQRRAAELYERRRMWAEAAVLWEALGDLERAHALYQKGLRPFEAARLDEQRGRLREAGLLYEQVLATSTGDSSGADAAHAHSRIGALFIRFGRYEEAARHLQKTLAHPSVRGAARPLLVCALERLGYRTAAEQILTEVRADDLTPGFACVDHARARLAGRIASAPGTTDRAVPVGTATEGVRT